MAKLRQPKTNQNHIHRAIGAEYLDIAKDAFWHDAITIWEVKHTEKDGTWRTMLKGRRNKEFFIAFLDAGTYEGAVELTGYFASKGLLEWRRDRFPPKG